jgi:hypothetical protein
MMAAIKPRTNSNDAASIISSILGLIRSTQNGAKLDFYCVRPVCGMEDVIGLKIVTGKPATSPTA